LGQAVPPQQTVEIQYFLASLLLVAAGGAMVLRAKVVLMVVLVVALEQLALQALVVLAILHL
jgi:hypothetical protein